MTDLILDNNQILVMSISILCVFLGFKHGSTFLRDLG